MNTPPGTVVTGRLKTGETIFGEVVGDAGAGKVTVRGIALQLFPVPAESLQPGDWLTAPKPAAPPADPPQTT